MYTPSTKERLAKLEAGKEETEILIAKEEISKPIIPRECIRYWLYELRKLNMESLEARRFLINTFLNSVVVFKDKIEFVFNYREGTETVPFDRLISVSDTYIDTPPKEKHYTLCDASFFCEVIETVIVHLLRKQKGHTMRRSRSDERSVASVTAISTKSK